MSGVRVTCEPRLPNFSAVYYSVYNSDLFFSSLGVNNWSDGCPGLELVVPVYYSVYHTVHYSPNLSNIISPLIIF